MAVTETPTAEAGPARPAPSPRLHRWSKAAAAVVLVALVYLGGTFLNPRVVPRLAVLPAPEGRVWFDTCNGAPGNRHTETWSRRDGFWIRSEFATLGGCIERPPGG